MNNSCPNNEAECESCKHPPRFNGEDRHSCPYLDHPAGCRCMFAEPEYIPDIPEQDKSFPPPQKHPKGCCCIYC